MEIDFTNFLEKENTTFWTNEIQFIIFQQMIRAFLTYLIHDLINLKIKSELEIKNKLSIEEIKDIVGGVIDNEYNTFKDYPF